MRFERHERVAAACARELDISMLTTHPHGSPALAMHQYQWRSAAHVARHDMYNIHL